MSYYAGRVAAITGAASGMGRALAVALVREGASVALADIDERGLAETAALLPPASCSVHVVNVADRDAMAGFAEDAVAAHGRVQFVFNNAGVTVSARLGELSPEDFRWLMDINFWGVVHGSQVFLPHLEAAGFGHIVNTSSIFGLLTVPTQSAYHASKFAVRGFSECIRQELAEQGIRVSYVMPGGVKTNVVRNSRYRIGDNQAPTKEEAAARFESYAALTAEQAAQAILAGVARNKARILVGRDAKWIALLCWLAPVRYPRLVSWLSGRRNLLERAE